jgi:hypothetical protein
MPHQQTKPSGWRISPLLAELVEATRTAGAAAKGHRTDIPRAGDENWPATCHDESL